MTGEYEHKDSGCTEDVDDGLNWLIEALQQAEPSVVAEQLGSVQIGTRDMPQVLSVTSGLEGFRLSAGGWSTVVQGLEACAGLALRLLDGSCRTVEEYRGADLAACWVESFNGIGYDAGAFSVCLDPLDRGAWALWPGEVWRVRRVTRRALAPADRPWSTPSLSLPLGSVEVAHYRGARSAVAARLEGLLVLEDRLGVAPPGTRWVPIADGAAVAPVPNGWRRSPDAGDRFAPSAGDQFLEFALASAIDAQASRIAPGVWELERESAGPLATLHLGDWWLRTAVGSLLNVRHGALEGGGWRPVRARVRELLGRIYVESEVSRAA